MPFSITGILEHIILSQLETVGPWGFTHVLGIWTWWRGVGTLHTQPLHATGKLQSWRLTWCHFKVYSVCCLIWSPAVFFWKHVCTHSVTQQTCQGPTTSCWSLRWVCPQSLELVCQIHISAQGFPRPMGVHQCHHRRLKVRKAGHVELRPSWDLNCFMVAWVRHVHHCPFPQDWCHLKLCPWGAHVAGSSCQGCSPCKRFGRAVAAAMAANVAAAAQAAAGVAGVAAARPARQTIMSVTQLEAQMMAEQNATKTPPSPP